MRSRPEEGSLSARGRELPPTAKTQNHTGAVQRPGRGRQLSYYQLGATSLFASGYDQRFSYCLYVPSGYDEDGSNVYPLIVLVHGTERGAQAYRDEFAGFAEQHDCIVLAPLFPGGIDEAGELNNYKFIRYRDIRFDHVLLAIVDEVSTVYRLESERFLLHGFSGGGHFAHRFFYLHPNRLAGVSIGAPGVVTLLDTDCDWWVGVRDLVVRFGTDLDVDVMRQVPVHMVVGAADTETWEIAIAPTDDLWMPGADAAGLTRQDRLLSLRRSFERASIKVRHDTVPGVGHEGFALLGPVKSFFADVLAGRYRLSRGL